MFCAGGCCSFSTFSVSVVQIYTASTADPLLWSAPCDVVEEGHSFQLLSLVTIARHGLAVLPAVLLTQVALLTLVAINMLHLVKVLYYRIRIIPVPRCAPDFLPKHGYRLRQRRPVAMMHG